MSTKTEIVVCRASYRKVFNNPQAQRLKTHPSESVRSQESDEVISPRHVCDFPATARVALPDARIADYPVAHINARLVSSPLVPPAGPATRHDDGGYRRWCPHRVWPNFGTPT